MKSKKGRLIIISGPSGVGKGTICNVVLSQCKDVVKSVSVTTRKPREGEIDGTNYFFKTVDEFKKIKKSKGFLESFRIYGNFYGTPLDFVNQNLEKGISVILEIDVQGALSVKEKLPEASLIFIAPPSIEELKERLNKRNTEDAKSYNKRIASAQAEIEQKDNYDFIVINDTVKNAAKEIISIIQQVTAV